MHTFGVAVLQHQVRPVATVGPFVVSQTGCAGVVLGCSPFALVITGLAGSDGEDSEIVLA